MGYRVTELVLFIDDIGPNITEAARQEESVTCELRLNFLASDGQDSQTLDTPVSWPSSWDGTCSEIAEPKGVRWHCRHAVHGRGDRRFRPCSVPSHRSNQKLGVD